MFSVVLVLFLSGLVVVQTTEERLHRLNVGIVLYPDVIVFNEIKSQSHVAVLPLGSVVIWEEVPAVAEHGFMDSNFSSNSLKWLHATFPWEGWIAASAVQKTSTDSIHSLPLWRSLSQLYSAGKGVMGSKKLSLAWIDQWPVGTGGIGALVGGNIAEEIVPVSISDLFVVRRKVWLEFQRYQTEGIASGASSVGFKESRAAMKLGDYRGADKGIGKIKETPEGQFEYAADLIFSFVDRRHYNSTAEVPSVVGRGKRGGKGGQDRFLTGTEELGTEVLGGESEGSSTIGTGTGNGSSKAVVGKERRKLFGSSSTAEREDMMSELRRALTFPFKSDHFEAEDGVNRGMKVHEMSFLDTVHGIATTQHIVQRVKMLPDDPVKPPESSNPAHSTRRALKASDPPLEVTQVHHRRWFASSVNDVIVGKLSCVSHLDSRSGSGSDSNPGGVSPGCLDVGIRFSRQKGKRFFPYVDAEDRDFAFKSSASASSSSSSVPHPPNPTPPTGYIYKGLFLGPSSTAIAPHTYMCLALRCEKGSVPLEIDTKKTGSQFTFTCTGGDTLHVLTSVEKQDNLEVAYETLRYNTMFDATANPYKSFDLHDNQKYTGYSNSALAGLSAKCWGKIDGAIALGELQLLQRHRESFSSKMNRVALTGGRPPLKHPSSVSPHENLDSNSTTMLGSGSGTGSGPASPPTDEGMELWRTQAMFGLGRYLFLSSGSKAVTNLQGLWTDGRQALWLGDYHTNINLQMQYWASDVAALQETLPPLFAFIKRIAHTGKVSAKSMYGCDKGWVSHGFTDGYLDGGLSGGYHWSFCVTCGAWTALSLWEHVTFTGDMSVLHISLLPAFRGIAEFFLLHLFEDNEGVLHSGPTSSPENSYVVKESSVRADIQLSLSPAIDASVLRQVSTAYSMAVRMAMARPTPPNSTEGILDLEEESRIAEKFLAAVSRMPFGALPVVGVKTGLILEYPTPFPGAITDAPPDPLVRKDLGTALSSLRSLTEKLGQKIKENGPDPKQMPPTKVTEDGDPGHRHFSSLHWLYPGTFLPSNPELTDVKKLYQSAAETLAWKAKSNGGHTSWSAAWEACLWARLGNREEVWRSLQRITKQYVTPRLLSLHPPTQSGRLKGTGEGCRTCYTEKKTGSEAKKHPHSQDRGMITEDKSPFQLDGNMGYLAAVCEALLQSHVPGHIVLLPALPRAMAVQGGSVEGLRARGNAVVSISWVSLSTVKDSKTNATRTVGGNGYVHKASVLFRAPHPWYSTGRRDGQLGPIVEDRSGFFSFVPLPPSSAQREGKGQPEQEAVAEVIIVYPAGKRTLHLLSSYVPVEQPSDAASNSTSGGRTRTLSHVGGGREEILGNKGKRLLKKSSKSRPHTVTKAAKSEHPESVSRQRGKDTEGRECARVSPSLSSIPSSDITAAANPKKFHLKSAASDAQTAGKAAVGREDYARRGMGIQIFEFPCKIVLRV